MPNAKCHNAKCVNCKCANHAIGIMAFGIMAFGIWHLGDLKYKRSVRVFFSIIFQPFLFSISMSIQFTEPCSHCI